MKEEEKKEEQWVRTKRREVGMTNSDKSLTKHTH